MSLEVRLGEWPEGARRAKAFGFLPWVLRKVCSVWKIHQAEYLGYMHFSVRVMHFSKKLEKRSYKHKTGNHSLRRLGVILAILQGGRNKLTDFSWLSHNSWHEPSHPCYLKASLQKCVDSNLLFPTGRERKAAAGVQRRTHINTSESRN